MRFGLFCSAQASRDDLPPETGQGFRDYLDFNVEAEELTFTPKKGAKLKTSVTVLVG